MGLEHMLLGSAGAIAGLVSECELPVIAPRFPINVPRKVPVRYPFPMPQPYIPDTRPYPEDFVRWAKGLKFRRFKLIDSPGCPYFFEFNSGVHMPGHQPGNVYVSTFLVLPVTILDSVNWRRLVAAHIRGLRFACRRQARPASVIGVKPPQLPWPR